MAPCTGHPHCTWCHGRRPHRLRGRCNPVSRGRRPPTGRMQPRRQHHSRRPRQRPPPRARRSKCRSCSRWRPAQRTWLRRHPRGWSHTSDLLGARKMGGGLCWSLAPGVTLALRHICCSRPSATGRHCVHRRRQTGSPPPSASSPCFACPTAARRHAACPSSS